MAYIYISTDLHTGTSGDMVASRELEAMQQLAKENNEDVIILDYADIHPVPNNMEDNPLLIDYLCLTKLSKMDLSKIDLSHMYGGCYQLSIIYLKSKGIKTSLSSMFHERNISVSEHIKLYGENTFPFKHITDNKLWKIYTQGIREADIVITPGNAPKQSLIREGTNPDKIQIIPHGTMIPDENKIKPFPKQFRVGYLGAIGADKGLTYLIQAWSQLNFQDDSILILAGNQSQYLEPFIKKYGIGGKYHLSGFISDIADFYNNISIYIQPSATEAMGMETIEAMSYGRPVVCSDGAGSADCITDGEDGFIVPKMNSQAIAKKIEWFKQHPNKIIEMGKIARQKSLNYSWNKIIQQYIDIWKKLLNE